MAQTWFIGSAVVDVIIEIDHLPKREEDLSVLANTLQMGGCAFNASDCFYHYKMPYHLLCPVGTGMYGDFVKKHFKQKNIEILLPSTSPNGCCYCFVEKDGERTFLSHHGAEYRFEKDSFAPFEIEKDDAVYVSGIEIEEESGCFIIDFLEKSHYQYLLFAPGPRLLNISKDRWQRMLALHPILHLNHHEAMSITKTSSFQEAAKNLHKHTNNAVIITLGSQGVYMYDGKQEYQIAANPATQIVDTIGAGDNHAGMCLYGLIHRLPWPLLLANANDYAGKIISIKGGILTDEQFRGFKNDSHSI